MKSPSTQPVTSYSYIRFSTPKQAEGDSLRRQTEAAAKWCERNGARLDDATKLHDLGKSAFRGLHRFDSDKHALAAFLKLVERGKVPRGSFLIIENLDRLSREHIQPALLLVLNLLQAGIRIVQLSPVEMIFDHSSEAMQVMMMVMELTRGHGESAIKADRLTKAWEAKRANIGQKKISGKAPFWLILAEDKCRYDTKSKAVELVRRIFRMARDYGSASVAKRLNAENILSPYGRPWNNVSVLSILRSRAVVGEFTPHSGRQGSRVAVGEPIADYYPRIITDDEFWSIQNAITLRKTQRGRRGACVRNLFTGLARDARDGDMIHLNEKRPGDVRMVSSGAIRGRKGAASYVSFPYAVFERAVLTLLREVDPAEVLGHDDTTGEVMALTGNLARVESKIAALEAELLNGDVAALAKVLREQEAEKHRILKQLGEARGRAASPLSDAWGEYHSLADVIERADDPEEARTRLRSALRRMVESVMCAFVAKRPFRLAAVQIHFAGGASRSYMILHRPAKGENPEIVQAKSFVQAAIDESLDLRKVADAEALANALDSADVQTLQGAEPKSPAKRRPNSGRRRKAARRRG